MKKLFLPNWLSTAIVSLMVLPCFLPGNEIIKLIHENRRLLSAPEGQVSTTIDYAEYVYKKIPPGNLFLHFEGFENDNNPQHRKFAVPLFHAGVFNRWPYRLYIKQDNTPVWEKDVLAARPLPSREWLRNHVDYLVRIRLKDGKIQPFKIEKVDK